MISAQEHVYMDRRYINVHYLKGFIELNVEKKKLVNMRKHSHARKLSTTSGFFFNISFKSK